MSRHKDLQLDQDLTDEELEELQIQEQERLEYLHEIERIRKFEDDV